ncbi:CCC motif membrane protein [Winogradskyella sp. SYSU M77433]|uniref:CCC motif membrane protein n=1 Tax=Winogradskyella sp. SYSU M77433 TaxID=3042722 RepID=UPI0024812D48|nr:CCC motif membrane protein [Winogradskyella sp. SYSU M77433]MDH7912730.1 CCC motif membrane protein [Winogradskyella sp. SYSU M77433]|tara:strand:+ start:369 stop:701 length:333 start_codon:yes stop_codon:yes gene_type:complete
MEKQMLPNATLALVMGILSIVGCCCYGVPGVIFGIVAIIISLKAEKLYKQDPESYSGYGNVKAGKIMGIIGLILSVLFAAYMAWFIGQVGWEALQDPEQLMKRMEEMQNQ